MRKNHFQGQLLHLHTIRHIQIRLRRFLYLISHIYLKLTCLYMKKPETHSNSIFISTAGEVMCCNQTQKCFFQLNLCFYKHKAPTEGVNYNSYSRKCIYQGATWLEVILTLNVNMSCWTSACVRCLTAI